MISERRLPGIDDSIYASKVAQQVDTLLKSRVPVNNIVLVGTSAGSNIVLLVSGKLRNPEIKFVIMGGCSPDIYKYYLGVNLAGQFLSVIESSDSRGTCEKIFENRRQVKSFREVKLDTGLKHGFIYKPYAAWLQAVIRWFRLSVQGYQFRAPTPVDNH